MGAVTKRRKQLALLAAILGTFVAGLDATVVNVRPGIRDIDFDSDSLSISLAESTWYQRFRLSDRRTRRV